MAFKLFVLSSVLAIASAGLLPAVSYPVVAKVANPAVDAVATTHENVVRSFGGTVSQYSKAVDTPYSSVRKEDTRISNNVYTPAIAKTVAYASPAVAVAAPVVTKTYVAPVAQTAAVYTHAAPVVQKTVYAQTAPIVQKTIYAQPAPIVQKAVYAQPAPVVQKTFYAQAAPVVAKTVYAPAAPAPVVYSHSAPAVVSHVAPAAAVVNHAVAYSPAISVAHVAFDGFGSHWGY